MNSTQTTLRYTSALFPPTQMVYLPITHRQPWNITKKTPSWTSTRIPGQLQSYRLPLPALRHNNLSHQCQTCSITWPHPRHNYTSKPRPPTHPTDPQRTTIIYKIMPSNIRMTWTTWWNDSRNKIYSPNLSWPRTKLWLLLFSSCPLVSALWKPP